MHLRADDGIRTRDPHLGKVMRYQLRYIRAPRTTRRPSRRTTIVHPSVAAQISTPAAKPRFQASSEELIRLVRNREAVGGPEIAARDAGLLSHRNAPALIDSPYRNIASRPNAVSPAQTNWARSPDATEIPARSRTRSPRVVGAATSCDRSCRTGPVSGDHARDIARRRYESAGARRSPGRPAGSSARRTSMASVR